MIDNKIKGRNKKTKRQDEENFYITNDMLYTEWIKWKQSAVEIEDRFISDQFGIYIKQIATGITHTHSFVNYNDDIKDELISDAIYKVLKNLKNMKEDKKDSFFNYISRTCYCSFYATLNKHYKYVNLKKKLTAKAIDELETTIGHTSSIEKLRNYFNANDTNSDTNDTNDTNTTN